MKAQINESEKSFSKISLFSHLTTFTEPSPMTRRNPSCRIAYL